MLGLPHDQLWNSWNYFGILGILWEFLELSEFFYDLGLPHDENFQLFPPRKKYFLCFS
jgi:hypothetical protein